MSVLIATNLLVDYLRGSGAAAQLIEAHPHRSISVLTWLEVMAQAPPARREATRAFLRSFERLSINEAIADEALRLRERHAGLDSHAALNLATARMNRLQYVGGDQVDDQDG
jgi:predicted nucleic acid-binding protein